MFGLRPAVPVDVGVGISVARRIVAPVERKYAPG
jgi:hypothetical protein